MSQGNSIFSSPNGSNGSNGEAPANPFASLAGSPPKAAAASPFAAVTPAEPESPFGFTSEEAAPENPQAKLPEKRAQAPMPPAGDNPFLSAASAPVTKGELTPAPEPATPASPFTAESGFEGPAQPAPQREPSGFGAADNPLSTPVTPDSSQAAASASAPAGQASKSPANLGQAAPPATSPAVQSAAPAANNFTSQPAASNLAPAAAAAAPAEQSTRQLELRAIFGSEGEMGRDEILTRAKGLPGIREVAVVGPSETAAIQTIGDVMGRFGFGGKGAWQMTCSGGVVDFVSAENTTLAVLREGRYSAGVWETLMIVARELGKLS